MNDQLESKLKALHTANQPDAVFADQLEQQLRLAYHAAAPVAVVKRNGQLRLRRRLLGIAASVVIIAGLFAVIPPLRSLAQEILDFFVSVEDYNDIDFGEYTLVDVDTIEQAEEIAGFEILEWLDPEAKIYNISADKDAISVVYVKKQSPSEYLLVFASRAAGKYPSYVGAGAEIENVIVNDVPGQLVSGAWSSCMGEGCTEQGVNWSEGNFNDLAWEQDGIRYDLGISPSLAETSEEVIAFAEALRKDGPVEVETIAEAEIIAGFKAIDWTADGYSLLMVTASRNSIYIVYGDESNKPVFGLMQYRKDTRTRQEPRDFAGLDTEVLDTQRVRWVRGQFIKGGWTFLDNPKLKWDSDNLHQLFWQENGINYYLRVDRSVADTFENVAAVAEGLEQP